MTISAMLAARVADAPNAMWLRTREGELTYGEAADRIARTATTLHELGAGPGRPVALLMGNGIPQVVAWFALARLGALHAPLDPSLSGDRLAHALGIVEPVLVLAEPEGLADVRAVAPAVRVVDPAHVRPAPVSSPAAEIDALATATLLFTSGTSGLPKACALSHRYLARQGQLHARALGLRSDDVLYCPFPLFHIDAATLTVVAALACGGTAALGRRFSASGFWDEVRAFDASVFDFMGATLTFLWRRPPEPGDRDHRVRLAWGVPMPEWQAGWEARFGHRLLEVYGLTDGGVPVYDPLDAPQRPGRCGRVLDEFELRIEPATDEILIRGREPGLVMNGYHGMPEATAEVLRDGWLRTGDRGDLDADGWLAYRGRIGDSIRRRGENISAAEVEAIVEAHPGVLEAAAFGVPSDLTEEDVMVCVVPRPGHALTPPVVHAHCAAAGPRHMVPRYVELRAALPHTPTEKVAKSALRAAGVGPATWDAEA